MDIETIQSEVVKAIQRAAAQVISSKDGRQFLLVPNDLSVKEVTDPHGLSPTRPIYIKQAVTLQTVDSLVDYIDRFKQDETVLFADIENNSIVGLIDYHLAADSVESEPDDPMRLAYPPVAGHVAHRATMQLPFSQEWKLWTGISGKLMEQLEFARFLEESGADVVAPSGAELLEICRDLQARRKVDFRKAVRTSSDNEDFEFSEETDARTTKGSVEVPSKFLLNIPVYFGQPNTELYAFLRWKLDEGSLKLGVALHRAEHVRQAVFKQIVLDVADRTGRPAMFGRAGS